MNVVTENEQHPRKVLHLIAQAHLDPVWLWPLRDGIAEMLTTLQSAVDRCDEFPSFRFTRSSVCGYEWVRRYDPRLFARIAELIAAGRWEVVGGWIEQPDCNLPAAESFLRHALYGKARLREWFGPAGDTAVGYNVDSFGHAAGLPQLLRLSGCRYYAFMRPQPQDDPDVPLLFQWESPDGSRVLAQRISGSYSQSYIATADEVEAVVRRAATEFFAPGFRNGVMWFGVGNHGGGPTREHIRRILELQQDESLPEIRFSTLREYFAAVEAEGAYADLPVWQRELNGVFRGCYSAHSEVKTSNRRGENLLARAEAAQYLAGRADPQALRAAWEELLFNQFHDILAGTCTAPDNVDETRERYGFTLTSARQSLQHSIFSTARRVDTSGEERCVLFAANTLPWTRQALISYDTFKIPHGEFEITHLEDPNGAVIPIQWQHADANLGPWGCPWGKLTAVLDLPPCGYRVFRVAGKSAERRPDPAFSEQQSSDQQFVKTTKDTAVPLVTEARHCPEKTLPVALRIIRDRSGAWGHDIQAFQDEIGRPELFDTRVLEDGPLLSVVRRSYRWDRSEIWLDTVSYAHTDDVELRVRLNWQQHREMCKVSFDTGLHEGWMLTRGAGALVERAATGAEEPCVDWVALEDAGHAFIVATDAVQSCAAEKGRLDLTLARSAPFAEHPPFNYTDDTHVEFLDQGWRALSFWVRRGGGRVVEHHPDRFAVDTRTPVEIMPDSAHPGEGPREQSGLEIQPSTVHLLALKPAEDGEGWMIRIQETRGRATKARLTPGGEVTLAPHEIVTLRLHQSELKKAPLLE